MKRGWFTIYSSGVCLFKSETVVCLSVLMVVNKFGIVVDNFLFK